jgi:PAS domain S-box-containing protein
MQILLNQDILDEILSKKVIYSYNLDQFLFEAIPGPVVAAIQKDLDGGVFCGINLHSGKELVGSILILNPKGKSPPEVDLLETIGSVLAVSLRRKQAEDALRKSEEHFRNMFEKAPIGIYQTTPDGHILMANSTLIQMLGYSSFEDLAQRNLERSEYFSSYSRSDFKRRLEESDQVSGLESIWTCKDGSLLRVRENARVIRDDHGEVLYYEGTAEDITQRHLVEQERERLLKEVQEQAQQIRWIVDTVPEGVLLLDDAGEVVLANPLGEKELKSLASASLGDTLSRLGDRPLAELLTPPPKGLWHEVRQDKRIFQVIASPIETAERYLGWVLVIRDVTEQRENQLRVQRQERLAAVGQLAAGIAHDFNNILATIILYAEMTSLSPGLADNIRARMQTINEQAMHASKLIQQILDFSRRSMLERQPLDLLPLIKEQVKLLERTLPENIELAFSYSKDEFTAYADLTRMQQMLTNLALNARDAMPGGGVLGFRLERVHVSEDCPPPLPEMEGGDWLKIQISDTGTGFSSEALNHIFEPFFTTKEPGKGTGLGLSQVHGIVGSHEGYIDVVTRPDQGTTFNIYLPALPATGLDQDGPQRLDLKRGNGEMLLVVEDNSATRAALLYSLETLNYRVMAAQNGEEALEILEKYAGDIALVVSDVVMPVMGGLSMLKAIQERSINVKIILLTGHLLEQKPQGFRTGEFPQLIGWLSKPVHVEELGEIIAKALQGDDLPAQARRLN